MPISLKRNFAWAFIGNMFYALCGYLLLTILTKKSAVETVGLWGIAQAVTLPVATFFSLKLPTVNITDYHNEYKTGHYLSVRFLASLASVVVSSSIGFAFYPINVAVVIVMMSVSQSIVEVRTYFLSNMQKYEQLKLATLSQFIEGLLTLVLFGLVFWFTRNLVLAILGSVISRAVVTLVYDIPVSTGILKANNIEFSRYLPLWQWNSLWKLFRQSIPLALVAGIGAVFVYIPRLVMDKTLGPKAVGYFTATSMLLSVYMMVNTALGNTTLPRLSKYFVQNTKAFIWLFVRLIALNISLGLAFIMVTFFFGKPILSILFTPEYAQHKDLLVMLALSGCILSTFGVSNWGLNATRQFAIQVPIYIGTAIVSGIFSLILIPACGIIGGAYVFIISYSFGVVLCLIFIIKAIRKG